MSKTVTAHVDYSEDQKEISGEDRFSFLFPCIRMLLELIRHSQS